jgi:hypothetical protein
LSVVTALGLQACLPPPLQLLLALLVLPLQAYPNVWCALLVRPALAAEMQLCGAACLAGSSLCGQQQLQQLQ